MNVGIGSNKLLAKMASDFEKPDKVHTLWSSEVESKMWPLPVRDLLWVGKKTEERLVAYGIKTIGQLAGIGMGSLTRLVGQKFAVQLHENANGRDDSPVETEIAEAKSYSAERTFPKDLVDPKDIDRAMFNVACIVAHRIRRDGVTPIRQVGLGVSRLTHESAVQMSLFEDPKMEYYREWDRQFDEDRARYEDAKMLAYERKPAPVEETPPPPTVQPPERHSKRNSGANSVTRKTSKDEA